MILTKREKLLNRLENHLRMTARQLVKFDTEEETLQYLIDASRSEIKCDFVGIVLKDGDWLTSKVWSGTTMSISEAFPIRVNQCLPTLLSKSITFEKVDRETECDFTRLLIQEKVANWFTVPLKDEPNNYGFCVFGFNQYVPLLNEMDKVFVEFGKDVAVAISLSRRKERQKSKISDIEWMSQNLTLDAEMDQVVERLVERAGKSTNAQFACIYLFNEKENTFVLQSPSYGSQTRANTIHIEKNYVLKEYFPYLETLGGNQLTVPLLIDLKTIGVIHVEHSSHVFTKEDLEILELLSNHVAAMLENARLYHNEKDHKQRLHYLLDYQQALVKETVEKDNFDGIVVTLSKLFSKSVMIFDRFMRPIAYELYNLTNDHLHTLTELATLEVYQKNNRDLWFSIDDDRKMGVWPVDGGGDLLGYLSIDITGEEIDDFYKLTIDLARNIASIQFIKQKIVLDAKEQVKDSFIHKLLVEKVEDQESIIQYANLFQWNLFNKHRVAVLSLDLGGEESNENILEQQAKKSLLWDQLKTRILFYDQDILMANKDGDLILIVPIEKEEKSPKVYWAKLYEELKKWLILQGDKSTILVGIGGKTEFIHDYFTMYQQAVQALNVVYHRFSNVGFAMFEDLGSYTLLHHLKDSSVAMLFIKKHLEPLLKYSEGKSMDLFHTLRVFLNNNGSIKDTSEELYIHRSSLLYRLEKIENLLEVSLAFAEHRFDLMMAYKLYDLYYANL
ncbi:helix-turn-helix domain-containing protein [Halalkalibacter okhensis]|uniref:PucR family transcriptional regulator n=1 Tax=Halalkalibacter okhensis TaxID=333138 RepID=A0A0B0IB51_9BACI|nr:helix-turn-helix domain-containing protein [Halalkalibacter okhensis]KHF38515.1 PucR family transcriptional regulator [Halalkalibacter okhensis]